MRGHARAIIFTELGLQELVRSLHWPGSVMDGLHRADDVLMVALHGVAISTAEVERIIAPLENDFPLKSVRWMFPRAPWRPVTLLGRSALAWYDVLASDRSRIDEAGLEAAARRLTDLIGSERNGRLRRSRIVLAGFSQGGSLALHLGMRLGEVLAGVVAISSALPSLGTLPPSGPQSPPFFLAHGLLDRVVPYSMGRDSMLALVEKGYRIEWHSYLTGHWINVRCLRHVARWLEDSVIGSAAAQSATARPGRRVRVATAWSSELSA